MKPSYNKEANLGEVLSLGLILEEGTFNSIEDGKLNVTKHITVIHELL